MTEADYLGPDPCVDCRAKAKGGCTGPNQAQMTLWYSACGPYATYQARRDLLERLKAVGERVEDATPFCFDQAAWRLGQCFTGPGWLVWIPEGQC